MQDGNIDGEWRTNPHVQSYVLATDQVRTSCHSNCSCDQPGNRTGSRRWVLQWHGDVHAACRHGALDSSVTLHPERQTLCAAPLLRPPQVGLKLMQDDGKVFSCYTNMWDTIFYSELGRC